MGDRAEQFCWKFNTNARKGGRDLVEYFRSFPVLTFKNSDGAYIKWFPSEYLYEERPKTWCLSIDPFGSDTEMIIGGSMMRQNNFIFDLEAKNLGVVRSTCSADPNMILDESSILGF